MAYILTTQQQVAALKKSISIEHDNYMQAIEQGETNHTLELISSRIKKLIMILEFVYRIDIEKEKIITLREVEFVDNDEQNVVSELTADIF